MEEKKKIAIGCDSFAKLKGDSGVYYIDKSLFIKDVIDSKSDVILITRPRRFGKTLNMSMLDSYLNIDCDSKELFKDLKIMKEGSKYTDCLNNIPVIFVTFNGSNWYSDYEGMVQDFKGIFSDLYGKFRYLLDSDKLASDEKQLIKRIILKRETEEEITKTLLNLCGYLYKHYGKKVLILIDEYDVPLQNAYTSNFYEPAVKLMKGLFSRTFKTNEYMYKTVVTGVTRITKEGIFTGANNFDVYTVLSDGVGKNANKISFSSDFGFTEEEVMEALEYFDLVKDKNDVKNYYDGYRIGNTTDIYNPWSITKYLDIQSFGTYWANTSSNDIINRVVETNTYLEIKEDLQKLLNNEEIEVIIDDEVSINNIDSDINNIWSLLLGSGYLKVTETVDKEIQLYKVKIPNREIMLIFNKTVSDWFRVNLKVSRLREMLGHLIKLEIDEFARMFQEQVIYMFSYFDVPNDEKKSAENFYHAFTLGVLAYMKDNYYIHSNREAGLGRYDIELEAKDKNRPSFILEFKLKRDKEIETATGEGSEQINNKKYTSNLEERGITNIHKLVFVCDKKEVVVEE